jgi:hypothetical protein
VCKKLRDTVHTGGIPVHAPHLKTQLPGLAEIAALVPKCEIEFVSKISVAALVPKCEIEFVSKISAKLNSFQK